MAGFERGEVVKVPFPNTDRSIRQSRPALVVSTEAVQDRHGLLWVMMITSAENRGWPGDLPVTGLAAAGLPVASVIRTAKIATIEVRDAAGIGRISVALLGKVETALSDVLSLPRPRPRR